MSVIVARALPDVRDGLKPAHRRVLFGMQDLGLAANRPYKKSARIVGEVLGKYHPHGDVAVYETMVRRALEFSMRYPLSAGRATSVQWMATCGGHAVPAREPCGISRPVQNTVDFERISMTHCANR
jgi:hypothetical protein